MTHQSILPQRIKVTVTRAPMGGWVAQSPDLLGFSVMSSSDNELRAQIGEHIASACRAQGFDVVTRPIANVDNNTVVWSITVRGAIAPSGPAKVGGTGRERSSPR
jgi:hypothetical protein